MKIERYLRSFLLIILSVLLVACSSRISDAVADDTRAPKDRVVTDGTVALIGYGTGKSVELAKVEALRNTVKAALLLGIPGSSVPRPLIPLAKQTANQEFIEGFLKRDGDYLRFIVDEGTIPSEIVKSRDKYRVGNNVRLNYNQLLKYLEESQVVKKMGI